MDDVFTLILLSVAMLIGCYLAGAIPLTVTLSEVTVSLFCESSVCAIISRLFIMKLKSLDILYPLVRSI